MGFAPRDNVMGREATRASAAGALVPIAGQHLHSQPFPFGIFDAPKGRVDCLAGCSRTIRGAEARVAELESARVDREFAAACLADHPRHIAPRERDAASEATELLAVILPVVGLGAEGLAAIPTIRLRQLEAPQLAFPRTEARLFCSVGVGQELNAAMLTCFANSGVSHATPFPSTALAGGWGRAARVSASSDRFMTPTLAHQNCTTEVWN